ncbi:hypothetical protein GOP47_0002760 [Adiantum capillus-veneris]|uniref:RRM domain-containing protein n=1 Tax=Adiantum capillus-veneris TaxID=13818 RepID=A0A9D4ZRK6_ADICA|nr:hypothetical protein GOP47_0002760 [Adiantum capillus-veneris]
MAMDDDNSVYVGGLSFDTTEDALRDKFEEFGSIVAVKIIIDKESGTSRGYGFITFTNPRAATKAINNMNGGSIEGRTIRVNEATAKSGNRFGRDNGRFAGVRDRGRGRDNRDFRFRDRGGNARQFSPPRNRRLSPGAYHSDRGRLPTHRRSRSPQGGRSLSRSASPIGRQDNRSSPSPSPRSSDRLQSTDGANKKHIKLNKKAAKEREEELIKIKDDLEKANQRRDELRIRLASLEEENASKDSQITELQTKSQKLEESLTAAVAATSQKQTQLLKLQRAFLQVRNCAEQLRVSENELQALIDGAAREANITGAELHEKRGAKLGLESEDVEWRDDEDAGPVNIDD